MKKYILDSELISEGFEESYYEWFKCPKCSKTGLSKGDNFCSGCGVQIKTVRDFARSPQ